MNTYQLSLRRLERNVPWNERFTGDFIVPRRRLSQASQVLPSREIRQIMLSIKQRMEYFERKERQHVIQEEEERVKQLCHDFYAKHPVPLEDCAICFESFRVDDAGIKNATTFLCCGAYTCTACQSSNRITECPFCRSEFIPIQNDADLLKHTQKLAEMGKSWCQFNLGTAYSHEHYGLEKNYEMAVYWLRLAADQGFSQHTLNLQNATSKENTFPSVSSQKMNYWSKQPAVTTFKLKKILRHFI